MAEELYPEEEEAMAACETCWALLSAESPSEKNVEYMRVKFSDDHDFVGAMQLGEVGKVQSQPSKASSRHYRLRAWSVSQFASPIGPFQGRGATRRNQNGFIS